MAIGTLRTIPTQKTFLCAQNAGMSSETASLSNRPPRVEDHCDRWLGDGSLRDGPVPAHRLREIPVSVREAVGSTTKEYRMTTPYERDGLTPELAETLRRWYNDSQEEARVASGKALAEAFGDAGRANQRAEAAIGRLEGADRSGIYWRERCEAAEAERDALRTAHGERCPDGVHQDES